MVRAPSPHDRRSVQGCLDDDRFELLTLQAPHRRSRFFVEPARPDAIRKLAGAHWLTVATVCVGAFMGQLDASIVSLAFPTLGRHFHAGLGSVQWVGLSYLVVLVGLVPAVGRLADMVGRKLLYIYGFLVFIAGSALCALAPSLALLDGFRGVQALGAAMLQANSVAIVALAVPRARLGRALGVQGAAQALGLSLGPAVGGVLIAAGGWRLIFIVNLPIGVIGAAAGWFLIPRSRDLRERTRFDLAGFATFVPALAVLLVALSLGNELGWTSIPVIAALGAGVSLTLCFVWIERTVSAPMIDLRLFRAVPFSASVSSGLLAYLVLFGALFATPFLLEVRLGLSPAVAGLCLAALPVTLGIAAPFGGHLADSVGSRVVTVTGLLLAAAALVFLAAYHASTGTVAAGLAFLGLGLGLFTPANNASVMAAVPRQQAGEASGIVNMTRGLGTSFGLAVTGLIFAAIAGSHVTPDRLGPAYTAAAVVLAGVSIAAASFAALRGSSTRRKI